jgi:sterol desaturase/sphingolipid hydroxylase (fatty acid hydroxylase superfamily)
MHLPFFMRHVHMIHHRSRIPTVWSVYSFHWLEAALLSTVPTLFCMIFSPPLMAVALYPLNSILLNFSGHCNYRLHIFASPEGLASRHMQHHKRSLGNYGFASGLTDKIVLLLTKKNKSH